MKEMEFMINGYIECRNVATKVTQCLEIKDGHNQRNKKRDKEVGSQVGDDNILLQVAS